MFTFAQPIEFKQTGKVSRHVLLPSRQFEKDGRAFDITGETVEQMVTNFTGRRPVTIAHPDLDGAKAVGWVTALEVGEHNGKPALVGLIEWSASAADAIEAKEYGYLSPVFSLARKGEDGAELGAALLAVGLTNNPHWSSDQPELWAAFCAALTLTDAADAAEGDDMSETKKVEARVAELEASVEQLTAERDEAIKALKAEQEKVVAFSETQARVEQLEATVREQRGEANLAKHAGKLLPKHLKTEDGKPTKLAMAAYDDQDTFEFMMSLIDAPAQAQHTEPAGSSGEHVEMTAEQQALGHAEGEAAKAEPANKAAIFAAAYDTKLVELKGV